MCACVNGITLRALHQANPSQRVLLFTTVLTWLLQEGFASILLYKLHPTTNESSYTLMKISLEQIPSSGFTKGDVHFCLFLNANKFLVPEAQRCPSLYSQPTRARQHLGPPGPLSGSWAQQPIYWSTGPQSITRVGSGTVRGEVGGEASGHRGSILEGTGGPWLLFLLSVLSG